MWQTRNCFITACGPFHWVSAKAVGIMDTLLCEAWCRNNGLFVRLPLSAVHAFHNQASAITVWLCARSACFSVNCDVFPLWCLSKGPGARGVLGVAGWLELFWFEPHLQAAQSSSWILGLYRDVNMMKSLCCNLTLRTLLQTTYHFFQTTMVSQLQVARAHAQHATSCQTVFMVIVWLSSLTTCSNVVIKRCVTLEERAR